MQRRAMHLVERVTDAVGARRSVVDRDKSERLDHSDRRCTTSCRALQGMRVMQLFKDTFYWSLLLATNLACILMIWELIYRIRAWHKGSSKS